MDDTNPIEDLPGTSGAQPPALPEKRIITAADVTIKDPTEIVASGEHPFPPPGIAKTKHKGPNLLSWALIALVISLILLVILGYLVFTKSKTQTSLPTSHLPANR